MSHVRPSVRLPNHRHHTITSSLDDAIARLLRAQACLGSDSK